MKCVNPWNGQGFNSIHLSPTIPTRSCLLIIQFGQFRWFATPVTLGNPMGMFSHYPKARAEALKVFRGLKRNLDKWAQSKFSISVGQWSITQTCWWLLVFMGSVLFHQNIYSHSVTQTFLFCICYRRFKFKTPLRDSFMSSGTAK